MPEKIDTSDIPEATEEWFKKAVLVTPTIKRARDLALGAWIADQKDKGRASIDVTEIESVDRAIRSAILMSTEDIVESQRRAFLQLRWRPSTPEEALDKGRDDNWTCVYELVIPLRKTDVRRERAGEYLKIEIGKTTTYGSRPDSRPFRDGAHADWDAEALGGLPVKLVWE